MLRAEREGRSQDTQSVLPLFPFFQSHCNMQQVCCSTAVVFPSTERIKPPFVRLGEVSGLRETGCIVQWCQPGGGEAQLMNFGL